jgi:adenosylcobinamide-phosphate synthase
MYYSLIALWIGFTLDLILGDPYFLWHPIRLIGKLITFSEKILRRLFPGSSMGELVAGIFLVIIVAGFSMGFPLFILFLLYKWNTYAGLIFESIMCYQLLATKSLKMESMKVYKALSKGELEEGRGAVSMIVGRDTANLSETGIIKATVETVAENTSDGSIAPMIFMMIGGAGLGFFYKAVNTMDSMVGYKNEKNEYFGKPAAKLDDVLNLIPARVSAYLMIACTLFSEFSTKGAWKIYRRDRYNHASPNSAHTEAVAAGALEIQLAGDAYYFGKLYHKKTIGDNNRPIECEDIRRANILLYRTAILGMILFSMIKFILYKHLLYPSYI